MIKRFLIWFLKQWGKPAPKGDEWKSSYLFQGFCETIEDHGEMYAKWFNNYNKRRTEQEQFLNTTICPHIGRSCSRDSCSAYRNGGYTKVSYNVSLTEQLIARLKDEHKKRHIKQNVNFLL